MVSELKVILFFAGAKKTVLSDLRPTKKSVHG